jgi:uncharacterized protein GlcG (DUF336 family)
MRSIGLVVGLFGIATLCSAQSNPPTLVAYPEPAGCFLEVGPVQTCVDGAIGNATPESFSALTTAEIQEIVFSAAGAISGTQATIAVVDRTGRTLAVFEQAGAPPANRDLAIGVARTSAFFSNHQAPLSSRTIRFISQVHFPPGVTNAASGALYGIEQSNRGCTLNTAWNPGQCVSRARNLAVYQGADLPCDGVNGSTGCGAGLVTGKLQPDDAPNPQGIFNRPVNAGGIPLYRVLDTSRVTDGIAKNGKLLGAIGVVGIDGDDQRAEFAAVTGAFGPLNAGIAAIVPLPSFPLPDPQNVFIEGIRLPFLGPDQKLRFNADGLPIGLQQPAGTSPGTRPLATDPFVYGPANGGCAPNGYLVGPKAGVGGLTMAEVDGIVQRSIAAAKKTRAQVRLPLGSYTRMIITIADTNGDLLAHYRMPDTLFDAVDVAPSKARSVVYFNNGSASSRADLPGMPGGFWLSTRSVGLFAQPFFPSGIDSRVFDVKNGAWYATLYLNNVARPCSQGSEPPSLNHNGVTLFAGATPLVKGGVLVGGLGVSGDGIEQDDYVTYLGAGPFLPPSNKWADRVKIDGVRLPMFKFPRRPEGVTECDGKPCP